MWLLYTIIIHLYFLGSAFVIYFRSPIIPNLQPHKDLENSPAKRLVIFILDGMRAETFYERNGDNIPNIRDLILEGGISGISFTRVPTETRPGHIAIMSGFYEDPTAIFKGWKENPVDFDSVFNRSTITFAWGSNDVLSVFSKNQKRGSIITFSYDHAIDFSGKDETFKLDMWVFEKVKQFLRNPESYEIHKPKTIFFLHLLGMDTAGHVHKPGSKLYFENLNITDHGIKETYYLFEKVFPDEATAYILTSDHGMTNLGSHGAGERHETETPIFAWGAGIKSWKSSELYHTKKSSFSQLSNVKVPIYDINQIDIASLISTLIGTAVPVNNYGQLPPEFLNVTMEYMAKAIVNNALQIISQYEHLYSEFEEGLFSQFLTTFKKLNHNSIDSFKYFVQEKMKQTDYQQVIDAAKKIISSGLEGIEFYQMYYKHILQFNTIMCFIGWIAYLIKLLLNKDFINVKQQRRFFFVMSSLVGIVMSLSYLQRIPFIVAFYLIFPLCFWILPLTKQSISFNFMGIIKNLKYITALLIGIEGLVVSFFYRRVIVLSLAMHGFFTWISLKENCENKKLKNHLLAYFLTVFLLFVFPFLPDANGQKQDYLLFFRLFLMFIENFSLKLDKHDHIFTGFSAVNFLVCIYFYNGRTGIPTINLMLSWIIGGFCLILSICSTTSGLKRLVRIFQHLQILYLYLSLSYEPFFLMVLGWHLRSMVKIKELIRTKEILGSKAFMLETEYWKLSKLSFAFLSMIFLTFFGTGNMATISSFDPNTVRCFVTTFAPFTISALVVLKLCIPILFVSCAFLQIIDKEKIQIRKFLLVILLACELMAINFLFMIKTKGSWLEIGLSISHFVIMEVFILILIPVNFVSQKLLSVNIMNFFELRRKRL